MPQNTRLELQLRSRLSIVNNYQLSQREPGLEELGNTLTEKTGLPEDKARLAVDRVVNYLKSKLPASVAGRVDSALTGEGSSTSERLGGTLGKKLA